MFRSTANGKLEQKDAAKDEFQQHWQHLRDLLDNWKQIPVKIGVIGNSGVGKSSFINAIRGLKANEDGAAEVDVVQKTVDITKYQHPSNPMLEFWDVPGTGTVNYPRETYLKVIGADELDFFIIVSAYRFTDNDAWLCGELKKIDKKFFFVRTKMKHDVSDYIETHFETEPTEEQKKEIEEKVLMKVRHHTEISLKDLEVHEDIRIFLIDNHATNKYDFQELLDSLVDNFPELKKTALLSSLERRSERIVEAKVEALQKRIPVAAGIAAAVAVVPLPGESLACDIGVVWKEIHFYRKQLGLDEAPLEKIAAETSRSIEYQTRNSAIGCTLRISVKQLAQIAAILGTTVPVLLVDEVYKYIPVFGPSIASPISFAGTYAILKASLDEAKKEALEMIKSRVKSCTAAIDNDPQP